MLAISPSVIFGEWTSGAGEKTLLIALDGSFCNGVFLSQELDRVHLLCRCRKDARLSCLPLRAVDDFTLKKLSPLSQCANLPYRFLIKITLNSDTEKGTLEVNVFDDSGKPLEGFPQVMANPLTRTGDSSRKDFELPVTAALKKAAEKTLLENDQSITYVALVIGMDDDFLSSEFPK